ncbi:MAG: hypothetical protein DRN61_04845 [Thaumarchaeota archaeon]|nr:MAG: hypothetical protein DRN61_04845 [Nitrososphaerota archaeon]HDD43156.1 hypothetical protein [Nitrososphaeria archaeon]
MLGVLVIATDNDSEGELIGAEILEIWRRVDGDRLYRRMRFNSTDYRELKRAWRNLEETLNWSWSAENRNDENLMILNDPRITSLYEAEFQRVWGG